MSTLTEAPEAAAPEGHADHHHHPTEAQYWKVGAALAIITLAEVGTYFIADPPYDHELSYVIMGSLIFMMVLKFVVIGAYFMHLKFDNKLFRNVFIVGMVLAVAVYLAVLTAFQFWTDDFEGALALLH